LQLTAADLEPTAYVLVLQLDQWVAGLPMG
jgi:hypothetical protein